MSMYMRMLLWAARHAEQRTALILQEARAEVTRTYFLMVEAKERLDQCNAELAALGIAHTPRTH